MSVRPGLVSVTFRQLSVPEVVKVAADAGLAAIEWGGDIHVPDVAAAVRTRELASGLAVAAYGSYYRAGAGDPSEFASAVEVARALGAPYVRVWAGRLGSAQAPDDYRAAVVDALKAAAGQGVTVAVEYHPNTLTDTLESALRLFDEVGPGVVPYWQPWDCHAVDTARAQVRALLPYGLPTVHVFSWDTDGSRLPLAAGERMWRGVLEELAAAPGTYNALLEFVVDNDPAALATDAETLHSWLA